MINTFLSFLSVSEAGDTDATIDYAVLFLREFMATAL
jgi:hypothetical protein